MKRIFVLSMLPVLLSACTIYDNPVQQPEEDAELSLRELARVFSELPIGDDNLQEVFDAVNSSCGNGYDEEYMISDLFSSPGSGVGEARDETKASGYSRPLRSLLTEYFEMKCGTKSSIADAEAYIRSLSRSDMQIYWPYSEDWDGSTYPVITFDPGNGASSNYGYELRCEGGTLTVADSVLVDEALARTRPVWVINRNDDSSFTPIEFFNRNKAVPGRTKSGTRTLYMKTFKMLRNYDSWFGGASEFWIKTGAATNFKMETEDDLRLYTPSVTDLMVVLRRRDVGKDVPFDAVLMTGFDSNLDKIAFLITEDDGGTRTSWKCSATVKYNSKSYGFDVSIPYNEKDDIVWRGQLSADFFKSEDVVSGRFGDVSVSFALE